MRITPNPYSWDRINLHLFYGRHALLNSVLDALGGTRSYAIVGGRKMGKTTLLRKLESELNSRIDLSLPNGLLTLPVYIDSLQLPQPLTQKFVYSAIVIRIEDGLKSVGIIPKSRSSMVRLFDDRPQEENLVFIQILTDFIEQAQSFCYLQICVLIDEIEPIMTTDWGYGFLSNWRSLLSNDPDLSTHICIVIAGASEMSLITRDIGSPLANIMSWGELSLFSQTDTGRLINEPTNEFLSAAIVRKIQSSTGGHPFLIQFIMHHICNFDLEEAEFRFNEARKRFLSENSAQFSRWWFDKFDKDDRRLYGYLADCYGSSHKGIPKRDVINLVGDMKANQSLSVLCQTGVVHKLNRGEYYRIAGSMFRDWFRRNGVMQSEAATCDPEIYAKLALLDAGLSKKYASAWLIYDVNLPNYSGAVSELRDVLTLVLHRLAPDDEVTSQPSYEAHKDSQTGTVLSKPTRRQRTDFIMRRKHKGDGTAIDKEIELLESLIEQTAKVVAAGYSQASSHTHTTATRETAWRCLKQLDSVIAQLL